MFIAHSETRNICVMNMSWEISSYHGTGRLSESQIRQSFQKQF
jgi:hypothetical protein